MPRDVEHDVRNYHYLTPVERAALNGLVVREASAARAKAMRQAIPASARRLWTTLVRGFDGVRPLSDGHHLSPNACPPATCWDKALHNSLITPQPIDGRAVVQSLASGNV